MQKQHWDYVEKQLRIGYYTRLECDGYKVLIGIIRMSLLRLELSVLEIDGAFNGKWIVEDCEERRRFICPQKRFLFPPRVRAKAKRMSKEGKALFNRSGICYRTTFPSMAALRRHFEANNKSIAVIYPRFEEARETAQAK